MPSHLLVGWPFLVPYLSVDVSSKHVAADTWSKPHSQQVRNMIHHSTNCVCPRCVCFIHGTAMC